MTNNRPFQLGLVQMDSGEDRKKNLNVAAEMIADAVSRGAKVVILPETSDYVGPDWESHKVEKNGEVVSFFREMAVSHGIYLHLGSVTESNMTGRPCNTSFVFSPEGSMIGRYSKMHLFDVELEDGPSYFESDDVTPGNEVGLTEMAGMKTGLSICYDLRFPELFRLQTLAGAELLVNCANFTANTGKDHWEALLRVRAIENTCFVAAAAQCGQKYKFKAWGHSMIIDPWGNVMDSLGDEPGVLVTEIDPAKVTQVRRQIPCLRNRRADIYDLKIVGKTEKNSI